MRHSVPIRWRWTGPMALSAAVHLSLAAGLPAPGGAMGIPEEDDDTATAIVLELVATAPPELEPTLDRDPEAERHEAEDGEEQSQSDVADVTDDAAGRDASRGQTAENHPVDLAEGGSGPLETADQAEARPAAEPEGSIEAPDRVEAPQEERAQAEAEAERLDAAPLAAVEPVEPNAAPAVEAPVESNSAATLAAQQAEATQTDLEGTEDDAVAMAEAAAEDPDSEDAPEPQSAPVEAPPQQADAPPPPEEAPPEEATEAASPAPAAEDPAPPEEGTGDAREEQDKEPEPKRRKDQEQEQIVQAKKPNEKKQKRPEKKETEADEPPPEELEWLPFVWTEAADGARPEQADAISAHDVSADQRVRPEVTDILSGPRLDGLESKVLGVPTPVQANPDEVLRRAAGDPETTRDPTEAERTAAAAAAAPATTSATTTTTQAAPPKISVSPSEAASAAVAAMEGDVARVPTIPRELGSALQTEHIREVEIPDWWEPASTVFIGEVPVPAHTASAAGRPKPMRAHAAAADLPSLAATTGEKTGQQQDPGAQVAAGAAAGEQVERAKEAQKNIDDPAIASGHLHPNLPTEPFAPARSPLAAFDDAEDVEKALVTAIATPLGTWIRSIDLTIRERWATGEIDMMDRAFGVGGDVIVQFMVSRNGRVDAVEVVQGSGVAALDAMARLAVPARLPHPPEGPVAHRITFSYRSR